ncbi:hypothetical protein [Celeribacter baekdonensis]|uniref:hypothetical protein n=1 Tax=Celeribacter baekdonensis TaxID=875171 RepID=UPI0030DCD01B
MNACPAFMDLDHGVSNLGEIFIGSLKIAGLVKGCIGLTIVILAGTNGFTLKNNARIKTVSGADVAVGAGGRVALTMVSGETAAQIY